MYVDDKNNAFICDFDNTVNSITAKGRVHSNLLTQANGIVRLTSIAFRPSDGTMIIGCAGMNELFIFCLRGKL